jgi:hypothetical protein
MGLSVVSISAVLESPSTSASLEHRITFTFHSSLTSTNNSSVISKFIFIVAFYRLFNSKLPSAISLRRILFKHLVAHSSRAYHPQTRLHCSSISSKPLLCSYLKPIGASSRDSFLTRNRDLSSLHLSAIKMSGKLDQSLDEILHSTRRKVNRARRPHKPAKVAGTTVKSAPVGGIKKSVKSTRSTTKGVPTGPSAPPKESKIIVTGLVRLPLPMLSCISSDATSHTMSMKPKSRYVDRGLSPWIFAAVHF